nr:D-Ala-D-Ala carboxypeptidase family metallohydrolase [uncultured Pseudoxanthomonas sp.]
MRHLLLLPALLLATACTRTPTDAAQRYDDWRQGAGAEGLIAYERMLTDAGVGDVVPPHALLRSSRRWRTCQAPEFLLPPSDRAAAMVPTLRVVAQLQALGIVEGSNVRSGYRSAALNHCSGGSARSRHLLNNALDFDLADGSQASALCEFWRTRGPSLAMGLGFYTPTRIHIDTSGHRTWGNNHRRGTSLCATGAADQSAARAKRTRIP